MVYFVYEEEEKSYHELDQSTCDCCPEVRFLDSGDMLIVHQCLIEPEKKHPEEVIAQAISLIMENKI